MKRILLAVAILVASAYPLMTAYETNPVKAAWSGKVWPTLPLGGISQGLTCNFDLLVYAEFFTGTATEQQYQVQLKFPGENGLVVAHGQTYEYRDHVWVKCTLTVDHPDSIIKGRVYEVRWTLSGGSDSLVYYYDSTNTYQWGSIILPGQQAPIPDVRDLAARVYGIARVGNEFSVHSSIAFHRGLGDSAHWGGCIQSQAANGVRFDKLGFAMGWPHTQPTGPDTWNWEWLDYLMDRYVTHGVQPYASLTGSPEWASCVTNRENGAIPIALFEPVAAGVEIGDSNYYARYIYELFRRYGPVGLTSSGQQSGTYWIDNPGASHYLPLTFAETFDECPMRGFQIRNGADVGWWKLDRLRHQPYKARVQ